MIVRRAAAMTCQELVELVTEYLEGALSARDRRRFEQHLAGCDGCTTFVEQFRATIALTGGLHEQNVDPEAKERLLHAFRDWSGPQP